MKNSRRTLIKKTTIGTTGLSLGVSSLSFGAKSYNAIMGAYQKPYLVEDKV